MSSTFNTESSLYNFEIGVYKLQNNIVLRPEPLTHVAKK